MPDLNIRGLIEIILKGKGAKDAADQLNKTKKNADKAAVSLKKADSAAARLGKTLFKFLGAAALTRFIGQAIQAFAGWSRQLRTTRAEAERLGLPVADVERRVRSLSVAIEEQTGILRQDTTRVFNQYLGILEDAAAAELLVRTAAGAAESGLKDFAQAATLLGSALQGEVIEPAKGLGIAVRDANGEVKTQAQLLIEVIDKFAGVSEQGRDTQAVIDNLTGDWSALKTEAGEGLSVIVSWLPRLRDVTAGVKSVGLGIGAVVQLIIDGFALAGKQIANVFNLRRLFTDGPGAYWAAIKETQAKALDDALLNLEGYAEEIELLWAEPEDTQTQATEDAARARAAILDFAAKTQAKAAEDAAKKAAAEALELAEKRAAFERGIQDDLLRLRANAAEKGSAEELEIQKQMLDRARELALAEAERLGADLQAVREQFRLAEEILEDESREQAIEKERERAERIAAFAAQLQRDVLQDELARLEEAGQETLEKRLELLELEMQQEIDQAEELGAAVHEVREKWEKRATAVMAAEEKKRIKAAKVAAQNRIELIHTAATAGLTAAAALFGEHQAFAVAQAIVDTWAAVNLTLASVPYPANVAAAALIAAQGLANVMRIRETSKGSSGRSTDATAARGFDDPANDRLARQGGRRWAADLVRNIDMGFREGMVGDFSALPGSSGSLDAPAPSFDDDEPRQGININMNIGSVYGGDVGLRELTKHIRRTWHRMARGSGISLTRF